MIESSGQVLAGYCYTMLDALAGQCHSRRMNPIVEVIAEQLFLAECKGHGLARGANWSRVAELRKKAICERVQDVLLAALNAGYVLTRAPELEPQDVPPSSQSSG